MTIKRTCRWCRTTFDAVNEFRWLCDTCTSWSRMDLGTKGGRSRGIRAENPPRLALDQIREMDAQERAEARLGENYLYNQRARRAVERNKSVATQNASWFFARNMHRNWRKERRG